MRDDGWGGVGWGGLAIKQPGIGAASCHRHVICISVRSTFAPHYSTFPSAQFVTFNPISHYINGQMLLHLCISISFIKLDCDLLAI